MEQAKQEAFDKARLQVIQDGYEQAFECINQGLSEDEAGQRAHALELYRQGRQHLLRSISVPSKGVECVGSSWDSARQMQQKMQETLNNITTRLAALETSGEPEGPADVPAPLSAPVGNGASSQGLYPHLPKEKPSRPLPPKVASASGPPAGASSGKGSGAPLPMSPTASASPSQRLQGDLPPVYSPQAADGHMSISYGTDAGERSLVGDEFYSHAPPSPRQSLGEEGEEMFFLPHGVQIFFVTPEGHVSAPSYPGYLRIVKFTNESSERMPHRPPAFLQVCDWLYPLMATDSPVLLCNTGVFMFPDMMAPLPGSYVGVVLSSELPLAERELFCELLTQLTDLRVQVSDVGAPPLTVQGSPAGAGRTTTIAPAPPLPPKQAPGAEADAINLGQKVPLQTPESAAPPEGDEKTLPEWSEKVAHGILTGASWLSWGLVKGAEYTGKAINVGASKLREHITPEDKPTHVSPGVTKSLQVAKQATGGAVKVSQFLVDGVCTVAGCVGRELAPHVKKHGSKLIPESMKKDKDGRSNMDGAMVVAASGVQGFATVWTGLEVAAKDIAKNVGSETVTTVKHKYGAEAGQATDHAVNSAINVGMTAFNIENLGIKAMVKKTGKQTAVAILEDYKIQEGPGPAKLVAKPAVKPVAKPQKDPKKS
ncbi:spartin isoform X1 [Clupea harengus]|uniref:Spartin n=1 Tax=Clupea harengus TaxID=7950 RepID=A0A6P3WA05_CLUHA|nr:spartin isoform X1 [Clupea harengus]XP_012693407.2 spartin isoform X1 [Clupea harengus]